MKNDINYRELYVVFCKDLAETARWLERSFSICEQIGIKENYSPVELDAFEVLTSRFARSIDFLIQKIYRGLDVLELEPQGTIIDTIQRAHKRGLIDAPQVVRQMKELRNEIAHEYTNRDLILLFKDIFQFTPMLLSYIHRALAYPIK